MEVVYWTIVCERSEGAWGFAFCCTFSRKALTYVRTQCHVYKYSKIQNVVILRSAFQFRIPEDSVSNVGEDIGFMSKGTT
jgi:hypothetical protein